MATSPLLLRVFLVIAMGIGQLQALPNVKLIVSLYHDRNTVEIFVLHVVILFVSMKDIQI